MFGQRQHSRVLLLVAALPFLSQVGVADEAGSPLAGLPSPPGEHVARIEALGDGQWLELGKPAPDPKWGSAPGRSWTSEMPFSSQLRGAFLYGEGVHGYAKPDGHYMDDLWFYDIPGHRWICCYPGANTRDLRLTVNEDGFEVDANGRPVAVAQQAHGYEMNTFDTHRQRLMSMPNTHPYWRSELPQRANWLKNAPSDASPWFWDPATGHWDRLRTSTEAPPSSYGDTLIYVPTRREAFFAHRSQEVWFYNVEANRWRKEDPEGPQPPFGIDATSCYDSRRDRIYIGGGSYPVAPRSTHAFWIYDLKTNRWIDPQPQGAPCQGSNSYPTKNAVMVYDSVNDAVLLVFHSHFDDDQSRLGVYVYQPDENRWLETRHPVPEELGTNGEPKNGFYDPQLNAVFIHSAGDSRDGGTIWVYRYQKR